MTAPALAAAAVTAAVVITCIALTLAVTVALPRGSRPVGAAVIALWLVITAAVAGTGLYTTEPWLGIGVVAPVLLGLLALRNPVIAERLADARAAAVLAAIQVLRLVGGAFLVLLAIDQLPLGFALPAGVGDVLVGVLAPFAAYALWRRPDRRAPGIAFNTLGLLDLIVAIPLGVFHAPGRLQLIVTNPTTGMLGELPMTLIPTFVVPLAFVLHVASLQALTRTRRAATDGGPMLDVADPAHLT